MTTYSTNKKSGPHQAAAPADCFEAMIAYEDLDSGLAARGMLEEVMVGLGLKADAQVALWRLDTWKDSLCLTQAVRDALVAEVVLLALHGERTLSREAKAWLDAWLIDPGERATALGVLLDLERRDTPAANETLAHVQWAAQRHPVDLFVGYLRAPASSADASIQDLQRRVRTMTHVLEEILHQPQLSPRCGVNE